MTDENAGRYNIFSQNEHLMLKYTGTGHPDISKFEWIQNQHRDTLASMYSHPSSHNYLAIAHNQSIGRVKYDLLMKMIRPCGENPNKDDDE